MKIINIMYESSSFLWKQTVTLKKTVVYLELLTYAHKNSVRLLVFPPRNSVVNSSSSLRLKFIQDYLFALVINQRGNRRGVEDFLVIKEGKPYYAENLRNLSAAFQKERTRGV